MTRKPGPIRAVIFDWAGTAVDFGSIAPVTALATVFADACVPVSISEIRRPMGLEKRRHLMAILADEAVVARWRAVHGGEPDDDDISALYDAFQTRLLEILPQHAHPIPGLLETVTKLRAANIRIGSNSGYSRRMIDALAPSAAAHGFAPDCIVAADEVAFGRPAPDLSNKCLQILGLEDAAAIKVDDTRPGIDEGRNAGLWTVAVAITGNEIGLSLEEWSALDVAKRVSLRQTARERARGFGADFVIDTVAELGEAVRAIEARITGAPV